MGLCDNTFMAYKTSTKSVVSYYNSSEWLYKLLWSPQKNGMHVGFWSDATKSVDEAVEAENREIIHLGKISDSDTVLDAGCGLGSTSVSIGTQTQASVIGITLVEKQVRGATAYAKRNCVHPRVSFQIADYTKMPFEDNSFDVVIGVESICYAYPKTSFLEESYRVLKKGGRLIIADGYMSALPRSHEARELYEEFCRSFGLPELIVYKNMQRQIKNCRFRNVQWFNRTEDVARGTDQFFLRYQALKFVLPLVSFLPFFWARSIVRNANAAHASMGLLTKGYGCYGIFRAVK